MVKAICVLDFNSTSDEDDAKLLSKGWEKDGE